MGEYLCLECNRSSSAGGASCAKCGGKVIPMEGISKILQIIPEDDELTEEESRPLPPEVEAAASRPENILDRYILLQVVGQGGMGRVYRAWHTALEKTVALKVMSGFSRFEKEHFLREARIAASLRHPNIIPVYDLGVTHTAANELYFLCMEFVGGVGITRSKLTRDQRLKALAQVARALHFCHEKNVILQTHFLRRFDLLHQRVRDRIRSDALGRIQHANVLYGGGLANTGSHLFDLLRFFLGDVDSVRATPSATPSPNPADPNLDVDLVWKSGPRASLRACDTKACLIFEVDLVGTAGRIRMSHGGMEAEESRPAPSRWFPGAVEYDAPVPIDPSAPKDFFRRAVEGLVEALETGRPSACTGEDGLRATELICAAHESARRDGAPVRLPLASSDIRVQSR